MRLLPESWPSWFRIVVAAPLVYTCLLVVLRIAGKRTLSKLTVYGLTVTVAFGSVLASVIVTSSVPVVDGVVALVVLAALQWLLGWWSTRSSIVARVVTAEPTLLASRGQVDERALRKARLRMADVHSAIRGAGCASVSETLAIVLETDGSVSVVAADRGRGGTDALEALDGWRPSS
jgi:uncharacterized membrane protein YcaP (DUF421 family)